MENDPFAMHYPEEPAMLAKVQRRPGLHVSKIGKKQRPVLMALFHNDMVFMSNNRIFPARWPAGRLSLYGYCAVCGEKTQFIAPARTDTVGHWRCGACADAATRWLYRTRSRLSR